MTSIGVALLGLGSLVVACGVKDIDPRAALMALFTGDPFPAAGSYGTGKSYPKCGEPGVYCNGETPPTPENPNGTIPSDEGGSVPQLPYCDDLPPGSNKPCRM